jgi:trimeric autotransporter adhesin
VYLGFKNRLAPSNSARFNTAASNALLSRLGIPTVAPDARVALTHASYQGEWLVWPAALGANGYLQSDAAILRFAPTYNGGTSGYSCMETNAGAPTTSFSCTITLDPASGALSLTDAEGTASLSVAFGPGTISGTYTPTGGQPQAIMGRRR